MQIPEDKKFYSQLSPLYLLLLSDIQLQTVSESKVGVVSGHILVCLLWVSETAHILKLAFLWLSRPWLPSCFKLCLCRRIHGWLCAYMPIRFKCVCVSSSECWCNRAGHYVRQLSESWGRPNNLGFRVARSSVKTVVHPDSAHLRCLTVRILLYFLYCCVWENNWPELCVSEDVCTITEISTTTLAYWGNSPEISSVDIRISVWVYNT